MIDDSRLPQASRAGSLLALLFLAALPAMADDEQWAPVEAAPLFEHVRLDGTVEAVQQSTVSAQTSGTIVELPFDVDDHVSSGDLIARLDATEQRSRLRQAEAELEEADSRLSDARQQFERVESLYARDVASRADFDQARNGLNAAQARLARARSAVDEAREQFEYTRVTAPYTGVVTARHVQIGESVRPGQALLSGFSLSELRVSVAVPQRYVARLRENESPRVHLDDGRQLDTGGVTLFPFADERSHAVRTRIALDEPPATVYPGLLVSVTIPLERRQALWIPIDSLLRRGELRAVFVRTDDGAARLRQVRTGTREAGRIEILAGVAAGEHVALDPERLFARGAGIER